MIKLVSTTEEQTELDRVANSDSWRTPPSKTEEPAVSDGDSIPLDKLPPKQFNEIRDAQVRENKDAARDALNDEEQHYRHKGSGKERRIERRISELTKQKYQLLETLARHGALDSVDLTPTERRRLEEKGLANSNANGSNGAPAATHTAPKEPAPITPATPPNVSGEQYDEAVRNQLQQSAQQEELAALKSRWDNTSTPQERAELIAAFNQNYTGARVIDSVAREISNLSNPVQVSLVVAKNPQLATTLSKMSQAQVAMVLGSISRDLEARAATNQEKPERPKVRPPEPIEPINGSGSRASIPLDQLPPREFNAIRNKQEREARKRWGR